MYMDLLADHLNYNLPQNYTRLHYHTCQSNTELFLIRKKANEDVKLTSLSEWAGGGIIVLEGVIIYIEYYW